MALRLDDTKKKRKKDRAARHALRNEANVPEDIADTGVPSGESVMEAIADETAEIVENVAETVEAMAEENPFVAPWAASGLREGISPVQTKDGLRADVESAAKASLEDARATRERVGGRGKASASAANEVIAEASSSESSRAMQSWTDFCLGYYSRMNPVAIQLRWMRAGAAWGEAYLEANRQLAQTAQATMNEMVKLWMNPFKRQ